jgi:hypothetical protein
MRKPRALGCIAFLMACGFLPPLQGANPSPVVVIMHPKSKDVVAKFAKAADEDISDSWGVLKLPTKDMPRPRPTSMRFEVGDSHKDIKDWTLLLQYGAPRFGPNRSRSVEVPFTVYYQPSADQPAIKIGFGTAWSSGGVFARPEDALNMGRVNIHATANLLMQSEAARVFADKTVLVQDGVYTRQLAPVTVDLDSRPPTATVKLKNKLGMPIGLGLSYHNKKIPAGTDQVYSTRLRDNLDRLDPIILLAGEEKAVTIELNDLKKGQEPRWCKMTSLYLLVDPDKKP